MSSFYSFIRRWFYGFRSFLFRVFQIIGNALISGVVLVLIIGGTTYAMTGTKMLPNFLSSGVDFISFFSDTGTGNAGVDAKSFYARANGSWIGYPGNGQNYNYLRNHTFLSGTLIDEDDNNYYMNPNGTSVLNYLYLSGVLVDLQDSNYFINMNGGSRMSDLHITGKVYDSANTNYYLDPNGTTNLNQLCLNGDCKTGWPGSVASLWNQSGNDISSVNSGNVGIGTTSPDHKLDVNGFIRVRSINNEGGVIRLDGNNGIHTFIENLNGVFRLINSAWSKELMKVDQDGNMDVAGKITTNQLCLNGDCKTGWNNSGTLSVFGIGRRGFYAPLAGKEYSCSITNQVGGHRYSAVYVKYGTDGMPFLRATCTDYGYSWDTGYITGAAMGKSFSAGSSSCGLGAEIDGQGKLIGTTTVNVFDGTCTITPEW